MSAEDPSFGVNSISSFAPNGFLIIADTAQHTASTEATAPAGSNGWNAIQALGGDVVIATAAGGGGISGLAGKTLSNNGLIYGPFGAIKLTSGTLIAYWK